MQHPTDSRLQGAIAYDPCAHTRAHRPRIHEHAFEVENDGQPGARPPPRSVLFKQEAAGLCLLMRAAAGHGTGALRLRARSGKC